jgi:hypothetical protein
VTDSVKDTGVSFALRCEVRSRRLRTLTLRPALPLIPVLLGILLCLLLGLIGGVYWLARRPWVEGVSLNRLDYVLLALFVLAAIALAVLMIAAACFHGI